MKAKKSLILVLLGPPGSGKGTQAEFISRYYSLSHISTGELFRKEIQKKGPLANDLLSYISHGNLVPDELVFKTITSVLSFNPSSSYILDGFPRTLFQAQKLHNLLKENDKQYLVINLVISKEIVIQRLSSRLNCNFCKKIFQKIPTLIEDSLCPSCLKGKLFLRDDDNPQVIATRLQVYEQQTQPIETFYSNLGILNNIDAQKPPKEVFENIQKILS